MKRLISILFLACCAVAQNGHTDEIKANRGFIRIPAGPLLPGCTMEDFNTRANDEVSRGLFIFEVWQKGEEPISLPAFDLQQYELTNAQWKLYLDRKFGVSVETNGQQTLESLAAEHIRHQGEPIPGQWAAIYALNWKTIYEGLKGKVNGANQPLWAAEWTPQGPGKELRNVFLPEGLKLKFYRHVLPKHWYGWNKLSGLSSGREYVDLTKAPVEAFLVPQNDEMFKSLRLRAKDFKNYPMRDVAPLEALAMAEWAGCSLPSEYELERAMRGSSPNTKQNPGKADWDHRKQKDWFSYADNPKVTYGPLPVDDPSVAAGDSEFGCRHLLGNVWELTRTFWDLHPYRKPKPDSTPSDGLFNYALIAKGGAWGSGWRTLQISTRTGKIGAGLDMKFLNRADSLGLRLARHPQPGFDLMTHTIRRMAFNSRLGMWDPVPHAYAMPRITGADVTHFVESDAENGYCFVQKQALGIAFAPLWVAKIDKLTVGQHKKIWNNVKMDKTDFIYLGVLRMDVPFLAGTQLNGAQWAKLQADRKNYEKLKRAVEAANKKKKKGQKPDELPPEPPAPDRYENATVKQADTAGVWRESKMEAGEYHVVYWYGFIGLIGQAKRMPPLAILIPEECKQERRVGNYKGRTAVRPDKDQVELEFVVEEWDRQRPQKSVPPGPADSDLWALSLTLPNGWPNRVVEKTGWRFKVVVPTAEGVLKQHEWNTETK